MCLRVVEIILSMHHSFHKQVFLTMVKKLALVHGFMPCTDSFVKKALKATIHQIAFASVLVNNEVMLAIQDIKDEVFWKVISVLLQAVFPLLKELHYSDVNVPAIDKIFHLVKMAEDAILSSTNDLDDETICGLCCPAFLMGCEDEMDRIYGQDDGYSDDDR